MIIIVVLILSCTQVKLKSTNKDMWISLIESEIGKDCVIGEPKIVNTIYGNNGVEMESWELTTCRDNMKYLVSFYPNKFFPDKTSEYEVAFDVNE